MSQNNGYQEDLERQFFEAVAKVVEQYPELNAERGARVLLHIAGHALATAFPKKDAIEHLNHHVVWEDIRGGMACQQGASDEH